MMLLVTYDVSTSDAAGRKRLSKVARICVNYGQRVQNSVFECIVDASQALLLKEQLISQIDKNQDSIRLYNLGSKSETKIEHYGTKKSIDQNGVLFI